MDGDPKLAGYAEPDHYPDFVERELAIQQEYAPDSFTKQLRDIGKALK